MGKTWTPWELEYTNSISQDFEIGSRNLSSFSRVFDLHVLGSILDFRVLKNESFSWIERVIC